MLFTVTPSAPAPPTMASSDENSAAASVLASSVLPTPAVTHRVTHGHIQGLHRVTHGDGAGHGQRAEDQRRHAQGRS